jgi:spore coat protein A
MLSPSFLRVRTKRGPFIPRLEGLEVRDLPSAMLLDPLSQPKFVNALPLPGLMQPTSPNYYEVSITQFPQHLGLYDPDSGAPLMTTVWGYNGSYPGATFEVQQGTPIEVLWTNDLVNAYGVPLPHLLPVDTSVHWAMPMDPEYPYSGVPVVTHLHGGHTESASDGLPEAWFTPGFAQTGQDWRKATYLYDNDQQAATLWYHDHALGVTRLNVYAGLAGFYLIRNTRDTGQADNPIGLPAGAYEVPLVIQDRMFTDDGQLYYPSEPEEEGQPDPSVLPEFFGDFILVNGEAWPVLNVEPRLYRLRLLNGSDSRFYNLWLTPGPQIVQIGTDDGLLYAPVRLNQITIGPGERADLLVDFSTFAGRTLILRNNARSPFPKGDVVDPRTTGQIMAFQVGTEVTSWANNTVPATLRPEPIAPLVQTGATRELLLFEGTDQYGRLEPMLGLADEGFMHWHEPITENPTLNDVEVWEIYNSTEDAHPIHLHLVTFQIVSRQKFFADQDPETGALSDIRLIGRPEPPEANEAGWKDTVQMFPGEVTRIIARFDREGLYVWHCHILSHEDHEMMRPYEVLPAAAVTVTETSVAGEGTAVNALAASGNPARDAVLAQVLLERAAGLSMVEVDRGSSGADRGMTSTAATGSVVEKEGVTVARLDAAVSSQLLDKRQGTGKETLALDMVFASFEEFPRNPLML